MAESVSRSVKQEIPDDSSGAAPATPDTGIPFVVPANVLRSLKVTAIDLENPSKETLQKLIKRYSVSLGLIKTARVRLERYGDRNPLVVPSTKASHCVRCHRSYSEYKNVEGACVVSHWGLLRCIAVKPDVWEWEYGCECVIESDEPWEYKVCYRARHTTNTDNVTYRPEMEEEAEEDDEDPGPEGKYRNETNLGAVTCWQRGCNMRAADAEERK